MSEQISFADVQQTYILYMLIKGIYLNLDTPSAHDKKNRNNCFAFKNNKITKKLC